MKKRIIFFIIWGIGSIILAFLLLAIIPYEDNEIIIYNINFGKIRYYVLLILMIIFGYYIRKSNLKELENRPYPLM